MVKTAYDYRVHMLLLLSFVTGLVDAVSVLGLDHAFVANMTGNVVFLGFAAAGVAGYHPAPLACSIAAFVFGAAIGGRLGRYHVGMTERRWLLTVSIIEAALLLVAMVMTMQHDLASAIPVLIPMALGMGLRNATVRKLAVADLSTTVLTLTLTGVGSDSSLAGGASTNWMRRLAAVCAIGFGALTGALLLTSFGPGIPLLGAAFLTIVAGSATLLTEASQRIGGA
jgi:uncharacterized membrane protein YoaK (UPF0700 family)